MTDDLLSFFNEIENIVDRFTGDGCGEAKPEDFQGLYDRWVKENHELTEKRILDLKKILEYNAEYEHNICELLKKSDAKLNQLKEALELEVKSLHATVLHLSTDYMADQLQKILDEVKV